MKNTNEVKHTPGPWSLDEKTLTIRDAKGFGVCVAPSNIDGKFDGEYGPVALADARLIAAAPEMLILLKNIVTHDNALKEQFKMSSSLREAIENQITKAEGR